MNDDLKEKIYKTESRIMTLEQTIFYAKDELKILKFDLENMKKIQEKQSKKVS